MLPFSANHLHVSVSPEIFEMIVNQGLSTVAAPVNADTVEACTVSSNQLGLEVSKREAAIRMLADWNRDLGEWVVSDFLIKPFTQVVVHRKDRKLAPLWFEVGFKALRVTVSIPALFDDGISPCWFVIDLDPPPVRVKSSKITTAP